MPPDLRRRLCRLFGPMPACPQPSGPLPCVAARRHRADVLSPRHARLQWPVPFGSKPRLCTQQPTLPSQHGLPNQSRIRLRSANTCLGLPDLRSLLRQPALQRRLLRDVDGAPALASCHLIVPSIATAVAGATTARIARTTPAAPTARLAPAWSVSAMSRPAAVELVRISLSVLR